MRKMFVATITALVMLAGCSSSSENLTPSNDEIDVVIDVRTVAEFTESHVEGSLNLDVESGTFEASLESLDKDATYLVYCRSGRRSAIAADLMRSKGFEVLDAGSLENMVNLGWPIGQ